MPVDDDIVRPANARHSPDRKTDKLIKADSEVEEGERDDEQVNDRRRHQGHEGRCLQEAEQAGLDLAMSRNNLLFENDTPLP